MKQYWSKVRLSEKSSEICLQTSKNTSSESLRV